MGLQFIDRNGDKRTLTLADMLTQDFQESYSDLFKGIYGFRPRGHTAESMLHFFDTYEELYARAEAEQEIERGLRLDYLNYKHGREFTDLREAECFNEQVAYNRYMDELNRQEEEQARLAELNRRGSPLPVIEAWEYGSL